MSKTKWVAATSAPVFKKNDIHLWRAWLDLPEEDLMYISSWLSASEIARADRLINEIHQKRYRISHAILREILSKYIGIEPQDIQFQYSSHGKPYLDEKQNNRQLYFNMSHSRDFALYAITQENDIGVDVEYIQTKTQGMKIAKRFFSENEFQQLLALPEDEQQLGFYRGWTRKEAYLKAVGLGLSFPLKNFDVDIGNVDNNTLLRVDKDQFSEQNWQILSIAVDNHFCAAIAYPGKIEQIHYLTWILHSLS